MEFARIIKPNQYKEIKNGKPVLLSNFPGAAEAFITSSESLPVGLSRKDYAKLLAIPEKNIGGILRFKIKGSNDVSLATPINRIEMPEFVNGGKTADNLPEFVIENQNTHNFEFWIEEIK